MTPDNKPVISVKELVQAGTAVRGLDKSIQLFEEE